MKELILVAAARPNFMKVAPVIAALRSRPVPLPFRLVHTGQHYDENMSEVFFRQLEIPAPHKNLDISAGRHGAQTGRVLEAFEAFLLDADPRPAGVMVVGDVNSTLACALAAVKLGIPVAHLESGLRSFDRTMPEEINRLATDAISDLLLVSEPSGEENLRREGVSPERIKFVGNVMIDTAARQLAAAEALDMPGSLRIAPQSYALVTLHRPGNVDDPDKLRRLAAFLVDLSARLPVVFPVHPRTRERLDAAGLLPAIRRSPRVRILEPLGYRENLSLQKHACFVLTDSGGMQEETSYLGVPCLTLRPNTERPVTVTLGTNTVIGDDLGATGPLIEKIMSGTYKTGQPIPGWDGHAAERVVDHLAGGFR